MPYVDKLAIARMNFRHSSGLPAALRTMAKICLIISIALAIMTTAEFQAYAQTDKGVGTLSSGIQPQGVIHALIIGISDYANYPDLHYADKDAMAFRRLLLSDAFGADSNRVKMLLNQQATQNRVDEALMNLVSFVKEGDRVFIYFSGHGGVEGLTTSTRGFLLTNETSESNLRLTSYRIDDLNAIIGELSTANKAEVYLIVDACHAGKVEEEQCKGLSPVNEYIGRITFGTIMLSSSPDELSLEGDQWGGGRGLFSFHLVNGLAGKADMDGNGIVDLTEIEFYVKSMVKKEAAPNLQNPVITGSYEEICQADPKLLSLIDSGTPLFAKMAMKDVKNKGYEDIYLGQLSEGQKELYAQFIKALDKSHIPKDSLEYHDFSLADSVYGLLVASTIPDELEVILRRKLIAGLQDRPQQLMDIILSGNQVYTNNSEVCQIAANLKRSAELMGNSHYLFDITMAKYHYFMSFCYQFNENYEGNADLRKLCLMEADSAIAKVDNISAFYNNKAIALGNVASYEEAIRMYDKAISLKPGFPIYFYNKGVDLEILCRFEAAIAMCDSAIALDPNMSEAYYLKGISLQKLDRHEEAIGLLDQAISLQPARADYYYMKGISLRELKRPDDALTMFDLAISLKPDQPAYYKFKIEALNDLSRYEETLEVYDKLIELYPDDYQFYYKKGYTLRLLLHRYEEAITMYDQAISLKSNLPLCYYGKGMALFSLQKYNEALSMFDKAIMLDPSDVEYCFEKANTLYELGRYEEALSIYDKAIALKPDNSEFYYKKGISLRRLQRFEEALITFDKAIDLNPNEAEYSEEKGDVLMDMERFDQAIDVYDQAIVLAPHDFMLYNSKGGAQIASKKYPEAVMTYKQCIEFDTGHESIYLYKIAGIYSLMDDPENSLLYLEKSFIAGYNGFGYFNLDQNWDNIRDSEEFKALIEKYERKQ